MKKVVVTLCLLLSVFNIYCQTVPTKGKTFWLGFLQNYQTPTNPPGQNAKLILYASSDKNTRLSVSIPRQTSVAPILFDVLANQTATITLPDEWYPLLLTNTSEQVLPQGVLVEVQDTISLFALNFATFTADASLILPIETIGTEYYAIGYQGLSGTSFFSHLLIVATEDDTQIEVTPSTATQAGRLAGESFLIRLNKGETYQIKAQTTGGDLTGTRLRATDTSGTCRPFAVYAGAMCTNIPPDIQACDHIYEQMFPIDKWGKSYLAVPFKFAPLYAIRFIAQENNTTVRANGEVIATLNAGKFFEISGESRPLCIEADKDIAVAQYIRGKGLDIFPGDPAIMLLNPEEQKIDNVTFTTVVSDQITDHGITIITKIDNIAQLKINGESVNPALFRQFSSCNLYAYAYIDTLNGKRLEGTYTITAEDGVQVYVYGLGGYESYAYSAGSFSRKEQVNIDQYFCTSGAVTFTLQNLIDNPFWTEYRNPNTVLATGRSITVNPTNNGIYTVTGNNTISGCVEKKQYVVERPNFVPKLKFAVSDSNLCAYQPLRVALQDDENYPLYDFRWLPAAEFDNPADSRSILRPSRSAFYYYTVQSQQNCFSHTDSFFVNVTPGIITNIRLDAPDSICKNDSLQLNLQVEKILFEDDFAQNPNPALWQTISGGVVSLFCGSLENNALAFTTDNNLPRIAQSVPINFSGGGSVRFALRTGQGGVTCPNIDAGNDIILEYSTNGTIWNLLQIFYENQYASFTPIRVSIPFEARQNNVRLRWRQLNNGGNLGAWAIDNVVIATNNTSGMTVNWLPNSNIIGATTAQPTVFPDVATTYRYTINESSTGCLYRDSILINVREAFKLSLTDDTVVCDVTKGVRLKAVPDRKGFYTYQWTPNRNISSQTSADVVLRPLDSVAVYRVAVSSASGCTVRDSVRIRNRGFRANILPADSVTFCQGDTARLSVETFRLQSTFFDDFNNGFGNNWTAISAGVLATDVCGSLDGLAARIGNLTGLTSRGFAFQNGGVIRFKLKNAGNCDGTFNSFAESFLEIATQTKLGAEVWQTGSSLDFISSSVTSYRTDFQVVELPFNSLVNRDSLRFVFRPTNNSFIWVVEDVEIFAFQSVRSGFTYNWLPTLDTLTASDSVFRFRADSTELYRVKLTDIASGCTVSDTQRVSVFPADFDAQIIGDTLVCDGRNPTLSVVHSAGQTARVEWLPTALVNGNSRNTTVQLVNGNLDTIINVVLSSPRGNCQKAISKRIRSRNEFLLQTTISPDTICAGDTATLITTPQTLFFYDNFNRSTLIAPNLWSQGVSVSLNSFCGSISGNALNITSPSGSATTTAINTTQADSIFFSLAIPNALTCTPVSGLDSLRLSYSTNGTNFTTIASFPVSALTSGNFRNFKIALPLAARTSTTQFRFSAVRVNGNFFGNWLIENFGVEGRTNATFQYAWQPTNTLSSSTDSMIKAFPTISTKYLVRVRQTTTGCSVADSAIVHIKGHNINNLTTSGDTAICGNEAVTIQAFASLPNVIYRWSPTAGLSNPNIAFPLASPDTTTSYTVTASSGGCLQSATLRVVQRQKARLQLSAQTDTICLNGSTQLLPILQWKNPLDTTALSEYQFSWSPNVAISSDTAFRPIVNPSITSIYRLSATADNCTVSDSIKVYVRNLAPLVISADTTVCNAINLPLRVTSAEPITSYDWQPSAFLSGANTASPLILKDSTQRYVVRVVVRGCEQTDSVLVTVLPKINLPILSDVSLCKGDSIRLSATPIQAKSFVWKGENILDDTTLTPIIFPNQTTSYWLVGQSSANCQDSVKLVAQVYDLPQVNLGNDTILCQGDSIRWLFNGFTAYRWQNGSTANFLTATQIGTYTLQVTDNRGCKASDTMRILDIVSPLTFNLGNDTAICELDTGIRLNAPVAQSYQWSTGAISRNILVNKAGTYTVRLRDLNGCFSSDTIQIDIIKTHADFDIWVNNQVITQNFNPVILTNTPVRLINKAEGKDFRFIADNITYPLTQNEQLIKFSSISTNNQYQSPQEQVIRLEGIASNQCPIRVERIVRVADFFIANALTPNGDGQNDTWLVSPLTYRTEVTVINRWGVVVYQNNDYQNEFDGKELVPGTYFYTVKIPELNREYKGKLYLFKE